LKHHSEAKKTAFNWIETREEEISSFHQRIWNYAEPAFREYKSAKAFVDWHRSLGFNVEHGVAGMPTAYIASWGKAPRS